MGSARMIWVFLPIMIIVMVIESPKYQYIQKMSPLDPPYRILEYRKVLHHFSELSVVVKTNILSLCIFLVYREACFHLWICKAWRINTKKTNATNMRQERPCIKWVKPGHSLHTTQRAEQKLTQKKITYNHNTAAKFKQLYVQTSEPCLGLSDLATHSFV